ncbi:DUF6479 family protein [Streptomyces mirabilis]|uniref:DUF6479 family protein n=1 Tax=Streptomyces mirabilis TaxID=68239 RepID=UPI0036BA8E3E
MGTIGAFLGGLVVAGVLMWAVRLGMTVRRREPRRSWPGQREPGRLPMGRKLHRLRRQRRS